MGYLAHDQNGCDQGRGSHLRQDLRAETSAACQLGGCRACQDRCYVGELREGSPRNSHAGQAGTQSELGLHLGVAKQIRPRRRSDAACQLEFPTVQQGRAPDSHRRRACSELRSLDSRTPGAVSSYLRHTETSMPKSRLSSATPQRAFVHHHDGQRA